MRLINLSCIPLLVRRLIFLPLCSITLKRSLELHKTIKRSFPWYRGVVVITTAQRYSGKPEVSFRADSNHALSLSEISDGENL